MYQFYAEFDVYGSKAISIRKDTRVYFKPGIGRTQTTGSCLGVVWMCNPGSGAGLSGSIGTAPWGPLTPDPTLNAICRLFSAAGACAAMNGKHVAPDDYLSILNCFYACNACVVTAFGDWITSGCFYKESIPAGAKFILVAWGTDKPHGPIAEAIQTIIASPVHCIFHDPKTTPGTVSSNLRSMWYPAHPLNPAFSASQSALATEMARHL